MKLFPLGSGVWIVLLLFFFPQFIGTRSLLAHPSARNLKRKTDQAETLRFQPLHHGTLLQALSVGPEGSLWGLDGLGSLHALLTSRSEWSKIPRGPADPVGNFRLLTPWLGGMVLGSPFSGLASFSSGIWTRLPREGAALPQIRSQATFQDQLWVATSGGLIRFAPLSQAQESVPMPEGLRGGPALLAASPELLTLVTDQLGIARFQAESWKVLHPGGETSLRGDSKGVTDGQRLWIGGAGHLREIDLETGKVLDLLQEDPDLGRLVVTRLLLRGEELWMATLGQGIFRRQKQEWQQYVPPFANLASNVVYDLALPEKHRLLAATSKGITEIRFEDQRASKNVAAWYPKRDIPTEDDLSRTTPEPRQVFAIEAAGGQFSPLAALGDILFEDPEILGERAKRLGVSCGTCHPRGHMNTNFFLKEISTVRGGVDLTHRFFASRSHNGRLDPVMIPSLRGVRHTAPYGRTQQAPDLRTFTRNVIVLEFEGPEPDDRTLDALVAYQREFDFLPTRWISEDGRLAETAPLQVRRGEEVFRRSFPQLPGGSCATCHPPHGYFSDGRMHDIGTGGGFDVPSLRNANYSAPYMHDGRFQDYSKVIDHFDSRYQLKLTAQEKFDLQSYLEAVGEGLDPYR